MSELASQESSDRNLIPKEETEAAEFLRQHPQCDGRGVVVGIMDTGVDPGAPGLQFTSDGLPKIIDMIDCCGDGDVDTSEVRSTGDQEAGRVVKGVTGRDLKLPDAWRNPSGEWHVGVKALYQLLPSNLLARVRKIRQQERWDKQLEEALTLAQEDKARMEARKQSDGKEKEGGACQGINFAKLEQDEVNQRVEYLKEVDRNYSDMGPSYDCVVFSDRDGAWNCCIDTSESGDLSSCQCLQPFKKQHKHGTFRLGFGGQNTILYNYSVNVYSGGDLLSIVGMSGSHGTHVAGIVAAHFPEEPQRNGVAPGAQLVVLKIGSILVDSMETQRSLIRGAMAAVETKCDLVNLSFGEAAHLYSCGQVMKRFSELTNKHGVIFVSSAGNSGPALSTVGAPASGASSILSVAAYITQSMMEKEYSMIKSEEPSVYTWSSRGPIPDGDLGVTVAAPGGAISPVPNFTERGSQLMNGTSMASPNACGCIALVLSALKSEGAFYNPHTIRAAVVNSAQATPPLSSFSTGYGLIQTEKAYRLAVRLAEAPVRKIWYKVSYCGGRGIYLRNQWEVEKTSDHSVTVQPMYGESAGVEEKIGLDLELTLLSTREWATCPLSFNLYNQARSFVIRVTPDKAPTGASFAEVLAFTADKELGPVFRIPVTLIKPTHPHPPPLEFSKTLEFRREERVHRHFFHVPEGVTWCCLELLPVQIEDRESAYVYLHALQLLPEQGFSCNQSRRALSLKLHTSTSLHLPVLPHSTMELDLARWWAEPGGMTLQVKLRMLGGAISALPAEKNACLWHDGVTPLKMMLYNHLTSVQISPELKLSSVLTSYAPAEYRIRPLEEHYNIQGELKHFELRLSYSVKVHVKGDVTVHCPLLDGLLYESPFGGQMWFLYNKHKQFLGVGDAFSADGRYKASLSKGTYTVNLHIMNDCREQLEKLTKLVITCSEKISDISIPIFDNYESALLQERRGAQRSQHLSRGFYPIYTGLVPDGKLPSFCKTGSILSGRIAIIKDPSGRPVISTPVLYHVPCVSSDPASKKESSSKGKKSYSDEENLVEFLLTQQKKEEEENIQYLQELQEKYPHSSFSIKLALCECYLRMPEEGNLRRVVEIVDSIKYDKDLLRLGKTRNELRVEDKKGKFEEDIELVVKALKLKFDAVNRLSASTSDADLAPLDAVYLELTDLCPAGEMAEQAKAHCKAHQLYALALKLLLGKFSSESSEELYLEMIELHRNLNWMFLVERDEQHRHVLFPSDYLLT